MISDIKGHVSNPTDYDDTVADMNAQELSSSDPVLAASISNDANQPDVIPDSTPLSATCTPLNETDRDSDFAVKKQRRVRTGCFTCRERHLKCDEAQGQCQNCRRSGRICRRGIRLNFIDTQTVTPPHYIKPLPGNSFKFQDDSRAIASEYVGGSERYPPVQQDNQLESHVSQSLATINSLQSDQKGNSPFKSSKYGSNRHRCLNDPEGVFLMKLFVEELGPWIDAMEETKYFTHILPFYALEEPMLYNALIACGARHMSVANPSYSEEKASYFYSVASRMLSDYLKDSDRDSALCATTAVALSVYEIMCFGPVHSRSHIIAATGLINECRWDSTTNGLGGACFWLNTAIELTGCLLFRRKLSSNPDLWSINMNMAPTMPSITGNEEIWTRRMIYICAKVSNFRLSISEPQEPDKPNHTSMVGQQLQEWETCKKLCDEWAALAPRSMMPLGHLQAWQTNSKSIFPEIWLLKRPSVIAHMFYHVTRLMLARTNPSQPRIAPEMQHAQQEHAYNVFGGVANVKDRGIAIMSIPLLLMAAECLIARDAQEEALGILSKVTHGTGWNLEQIKGQLQEIWAWRLTHEPRSIHSTADASMLYDDFDPFEIPHDVMNPGMDFGGFSVDNHGCHSFEDYYLGSFLEA
ncbi:hypothetical protein P175DRAFT_0498486 [Aspergillus ochraceoroseus IBT 24754]|uniref:Zn(2)-C6 fungal-type domain-containing protein n=1 Tax=Aspergillus ochraceoroseus IBT 24754 TaxID=1392256 RepID=A0A2T5MA02_9EURO|nr:uncharacterized protein P175DRAFT_0498486 [Aspergillus ochraceoroseus IBT 24754]PTU25368.1 hypothetical protein P175DRAFT_0498486 [Aspergillus ochraceoroseus IBT 24754]